MPSIDLNPEIAYSIIDRVRNFYAESDVDQDATVDPASFEDGYSQEPLSDPTFVELEVGIDDLEPDQQVALVALMWMGRGDFDGNQWTEAYRLAKERWNNRTVDYLMSTPLLADYMEEALNQLGYTRE
ncbi:MAG: DUF3775 domain-containing protein [Gammaproteobacteria bacterium]|nr:DUF3775 domain-containing protein [Gammaproteobacteria bacterium]